MLSVLALPCAFSLWNFAPKKDCSGMGNVNQGFFKMSFVVVVVVVVDSSEAFVGRMSRYYGSVIRNCT